MSKIFPSAEFIIAGNGQAALEQLKFIQPDILFLDINMPIMDGKEFLAALSSQHEKLTFPIIITTSSIDPNDLKETKNHPFVVDFIEKPLKRERIELAVSSFIN